MGIDFSTEKKPLSTFALAGLADVVFLLLVFFLLTSSFIPQFGIQVDLPNTNSAAPTMSEYITVVVTHEGRFFVEQEPTTGNDLLESIRTQLNGRTTLVLRADEEAKVRDFARVAGIARALNLRFLMATEREKSP
jgi:biopolymer transport protein ExbD